MDSVDNKWLHVAPRPDVLTVLCSKHEPSDNEIVGNGKLVLDSALKAYTARDLIQAQTITYSKNTDDIFPLLPLDYVLLQLNEYKLN